jgi:hypothetical protein
MGQRIGDSACSRYGFVDKAQVMENGGRETGHRGLDRGRVTWDRGWGIRDRGLETEIEEVRWGQRK